MPTPAAPKLRDFRNRLAIPNPFERHPRDANQYPDSECPGCPPGFVFDKRRGMCVPYVMHDPVTWIGSTSPGCSPGWSSARVDLVTGEILPRLAPVEREKQTMICIPILSTNFGRR